MRSHSPGTGFPDPLMAAGQLLSGFSGVSSTISIYKKQVSAGHSLSGFPRARSRSPGADFPDPLMGAEQLPSGFPGVSSTISIYKKQVSAGHSLSDF